MNIESLYPYIAVAYGTFGIVFGVMLWWKTQRRIDRTKSAIEIQVANAVTDISSRVDSKLGSLDISSLGKQVDALGTKFTEVANNIPDFDLDDFDERLDKLKADLPDLIGSHVNMAVKGVQAEQANAVAAYLKDTLPEWERMSKEAQAELMGQVNPAEIIGNAILNYKVPPAIRKKAPWAIPLIEGQKLQAMQWLQGIAALKAQGTVTMESGGGYGGSFQPGLRR